MRKYMTSLQCQTCHGYRLNRQALAVKIAGKHIGEVSDLPIADELAFLRAWNLVSKRLRSHARS